MVEQMWRIHYLIYLQNIQILNFHEEFLKFCIGLKLQIQYTLRRPGLTFVHSFHKV